MGRPMTRLVLATATLATLGCEIPMWRCETDPRRYVSEIREDCDACDGGQEVCVERSAEDVARYDRERAACEAVPGAEWRPTADGCRCPTGSETTGSADAPCAAREPAGGG